MPATQLGPVREARLFCRLFLLLIALSIIPTAVRGEPVSVNSPAGQGYAFSHQGNCYVILPEHVHLGTVDLTLSAGSPPEVGAAVVIQMFPAADLSLAFVTGGLEGRCTPSFSDLPRNVEDLIASGGEVTFVTVSDVGRVQRVKGRVATLTYERMRLDVIDEAPGTNMFQGRSGGIVLAGNKPVGMLVEASDTRVAEALRMDAIVARIDRLLKSRDADPRDISTADSTTKDEGSSVGLFGQATGISRCSAEPVSPDATCWALAEGTGPLLVDNQNLPFELEVKLKKGASVKHVGMSSEFEEETSTAPKTVVVERAAGSSDRLYWLSYGRADMSPLGDLTIRHGASLRTQALRITIVDTWDSTLPFRIDRIDVR